MNTDRFIRRAELAGATLTIVGAVLKIMHWLPSFHKLYLVGILVYLIAELARYFFRLPIKHGVHHFRFGLHAISLLLVAFTLLTSSDLFAFALVMLAVDFVISAFFPVREPAA